MSQSSHNKQSRFTVEEWPPANYAAISANIAVSGIKGGHEKYVMFLKYGSPPTFAKYDYRSVVTASDSYTGDKLFSQDIRIEQPFPGFVVRTDRLLSSAQLVTLNVYIKLCENSS